MHYSFILIEPPPQDPDEMARLFRFIAGCGYEGVELNLTGPLLDSLDQIEQAAAASNLVVPSFLTGEAYRQGLCLSTADTARRTAAVERLIAYLPVAVRFHAILVVGLLQGLACDEPDPQVANERIVEGLTEVARAAEAAGAELVIEPVNHLQVGFNHTVDEVMRLIAVIGSPAIRPMVDTIHMNIEESSLTGPIRECGPALRHVHLCESNGGLLGSGHIDFKVVLGALDDVKYDGFASVKVYRKATLAEAATSSMRYLRRCQGD